MSSMTINIQHNENSVLTGKNEMLLRAIRYNYEVQIYNRDWRSSNSLPLLIVFPTLPCGWHLRDFQPSNIFFLQLFRSACQIHKLERNGNLGRNQKEMAVFPWNRNLTLQSQPWPMTYHSCKRIISVSYTAWTNNKQF